MTHIGYLLHYPARHCTGFHLTLLDIDVLCYHPDNNNHLDHTQHTRCFPNNTHHHTPMGSCRYQLCPHRYNVHVVVNLYMTNNLFLTMQCLFQYMFRWDILYVIQNLSANNIVFTFVSATAFSNSLSKEESCFTYDSVLVL